MWNHEKSNLRPKTNRKSSDNFIIIESAIIFFMPASKTDFLKSYLFPVHIETVSSALNPVLEVQLYNGRYILNSDHMNYSFGSLQVLFRKVFRRLRLNWSNIDKALILGFGTGSLVSIIRHYKPGCAITGVEMDDKVLELGQKYFNTSSLRNVTVHHARAEQYIENIHEKFGLIVIDAYIDRDVPGELETLAFLTNVKKALEPGGVVVFNKVVYSKSGRTQLPVLKQLYEQVFGNVEIKTVMITGKIFIAMCQQMND